MTIEEKWQVRSPFVKRKVRVTPKGIYGLTQLGKSKAEEYKESGPKGEVMAAMDTDGPGTVKEIADSSRIPTEKVKRVIIDLVASGYAQKLHSEE